MLVCTQMSRCFLKKIFQLHDQVGWRLLVVGMITLKLCNGVILLYPYNRHFVAIFLACWHCMLKQIEAGLYRYMTNIPRKSGLLNAIGLVLKLSCISICM